MNTRGRILLAEDDEIIATIINDLLVTQGYAVSVCADGRQAWDSLCAEGPGYDVVLLDRGLPLMDGMELLGRIKRDAAMTHLPVIMETAQGDLESIREGLAQGAYYYLTKPFQPDLLLAVVNAAMNQSREFRELAESVRRAERPLALMASGTFLFRTLEEARSLANYLAGTCPHPERAIQGLLELLVNALEHGNLEISYAEKGELVRQDRWQDEVERRQLLAEYRDRQVEVSFQRQADALRFSIVDQGRGFAWRNYLDFSPDRAFDPHGRGIAMACRLGFGQVEYQGSGNRVVVIVPLTAAAAAEHATGTTP